METVRRAAEILDGLLDGGRPDAGVLRKLPLAEAWSTIVADDVYRIGAVVETSSERPARPRVVPLLALDVDEQWALVLIDDELRWWALGDRLRSASVPQDCRDVARRAVAWARRWLHDS